MKFKLGDFVKSSWNTYGKNTICVVDRIFTRKDGNDMLRLKFTLNGEEKLINVPQRVCEIDISYGRNDKLNKLFNDND
jgi:hypothetical protein